VGKETLSLRTLSKWGYVLALGSLFGYAVVGYRFPVPNGPTAIGLLSVWVVMAVVGSSLIGFKYHLIKERRLRTRVMLGDVAMLLAELVLLAVLPSFMGIVRGLILLVFFTPYLLWWFRQLEPIQTA